MKLLFDKLKDGMLILLISNIVLCCSHNNSGNESKNSLTNVSSFIESFFSKNLNQGITGYSYAVYWRSEPLLVGGKGFARKPLKEGDSSQKIFKIYISPDEDYMILTVAKKNLQARLYVSFKNFRLWTSPEYIGNIVGADLTSNFHYITPDDEYLLFIRNFRQFLFLPQKLFSPKRTNA